MKFAIIRSECSFTKGGAERYAANLCRELCEMGHHVWILAEIFDPTIHPDLIHIPIKVNRATSATRNHSFNENAQRAAKELDADHIIALSRSYPSDAFRVSDPLHCYWMNLRYPGKIRNFIERLNPRHRAILKLERAIIDPENTRIIVTNSELSKKLIGEYYNYPPERIHVIYNGVDLDQFSPNPDYKENDELKFLFVGQDFKRKGLASVIEAFAMARKAGYPSRLRVIGSDDPVPYRKLASQLKVIDHIDFEGPTRNIQKAYQTSDLFIFPSLYDPFANVVLESLACGLPALTTNTNGSSEVITEQQTGYVVQGDSKDLSIALSKCIKSFCKLIPSERASMRQQSRITAEHYTIRNNAASLVEKLETSHQGDAAKART